MTAGVEGVHSPRGGIEAITSRDESSPRAPPPDRPLGTRHDRRQNLCPVCLGLISYPSGLFNSLFQNVGWLQVSE